MRNTIADLCQDETGATAIEYGLIAALIAVAVMSAMSAVADSTIFMWMKISSETLNAHNEKASA